MSDTDAWLMATLGDQLARHLEWLIEEPNSGLIPEVLDAVKASAARDVQQWKNGYKQCGFVRPEDLTDADTSTTTAVAAEDTRGDADMHELARR